tara:strand:+ start:860 stop:1066 length:207 start_codon:yes stop_codon:yes gene_type:complete
MTRLSNSHRPQRSTSPRPKIQAYALAVSLVSIVLASAYAGSDAHYKQCLEDAETARQKTECHLTYLGR